MKCACSFYHIPTLVMFKLRRSEQILDSQNQVESIFALYFFSCMTDYWDIHERVRFECGLLEHAFCVWLTLGWQDQEGCVQIGLLMWASQFLREFFVIGLLCSF